MAEILGFPGVQDRIVVCECGCSTFELLEAGGTLCAACGADGLGAVSWYAVKPDGREWVGEEPVRAVQGNGSVEFARRRAVQIATDDEVVLLVSALPSGSVTTWGAIETEDQRAWMLERLDQARAMILGWRI